MAEKKEWWSARELAGKPGMPATPKGVIARAEREIWMDRDRPGKGGGREYHFSSLPQETRAAIAAETISQEMKTSTESSVPEVEARCIEAAKRDAEKLRAEEKARLEEILKRKQEGLRQFGLLPEWKQRRAKAKFEILRACVKYISDGNLPKTAGEELFAKALQLNQVGLPEWVKAEINVSILHEGTIRRWFREEETGGLYALVDHYGTRRNTGKIDRDPQLQKIILALVKKQPDIKPKHIYQYLRAEFQSLSDMSERSIDRWLSKWKTSNPQEYLHLTNPDEWKSRYQMAVGKYDGNITALNQLWEIDSTPADVMLTDGRHSVIGVIDIYSRRGMLLVSKTSKATMIATLIRRAILAWGIPQAIRTDNGQDYTSQHIQRILRDLGIEQVICAPFASEEKPFIERFLGTYSHDVIEVCPGYIGHNVTDRKNIEARKAFSSRIMNPEDVIEVSLGKEDLQKISDAWARDRYAHSPHAGLDGKTPFQMVQEWKEQPRRIENERVLDILLAEAPGDNGKREIRKKGIQVDNVYFSNEMLGIHAGRTAQVFLDPEDFGRIFVFLLLEDGSKRFLCEAVNMDRLGLSRQEVAVKTKAIQKAYLAEQSSAYKEFSKMIKKNIHQVLLDADSAKNGMLVPFPKAGTIHTTPAIEAAEDAVSDLEPMTPERIEQSNRENPISEESKQQAKIIRLESKRPPPDEMAEKRDRFNLWLEFRKREFQGLTPEQEAWRTAYEGSNEFKGQYRVWESFYKDRQA